MIVLDASVLVNALADDHEAGGAARQVIGQAEDLAAPDLIDVETAAVLRRRWQAGSITGERFDAAVVDLGDLPCRRYPTGPLIRRAVELRDNVSMYDAVYVALAEALECPLVTADERLVRLSGPTCQFEVVRA